MATKKLTDAEKAQRAKERAAQKNAQQAAASGDKPAMAQAAAGLVGTMPLDVIEDAGRRNRTVAVACKIPHGIIIQAYSKVTEHEPVVGGGMRAVDRYRPVGSQYKVHGTLAKVGQRAPYIRDNSGGYAITEGIPLETWESFMQHNKDSAFVTNHLLFGHEKLDTVMGWANEHKAVRTNFEHLDVSLVAGPDGVRRIKDTRARRVAPAVTDGKIEIGAGA